MIEAADMIRWIELRHLGRTCVGLGCLGFQTGDHTHVDKEKGAGNTARIYL